MAERQRSRSPAKRSGPANLTGFEDNRCQCESYGSCVACSDRRAEAWKYRRPLIELAKVAESIAEERAVAEVASERQIAHQLMIVWGGSAS